MEGIREGKEPFEALFSENHYILLILNAILASCEKLKDHEMIKHKVKVYSMLLAFQRKQLLIVWYRSIQYSCALKMYYYICIRVLQGDLYLYLYLSISIAILFMCMGRE